jgi:competence protein ComEA
MKFKAIGELFDFTQKERYGIIALAILIFILIAVHISLPYLVKDKVADTSKWDSEVDEYLSHQDKQEESGKSKALTPFDPNNVTRNELAQMGVPSNVASKWINYLNKGGRFKKKKDVKKIYGMTATLFNQLDTFILLPQKAIRNPVVAKTAVIVPKALVQGRDTMITVRRSPTLNHVLKRISTVELNSADSISLVKLPGIGPVLASRIIRYRNLLGGYYSVVQLHEVFGLRDEHYNSASPYLNVDVERLNRFNINFATLTELGRHPYIGFKTARKILNLRDKRGKYSSVDDLTYMMTMDSLKRLIPYLIFNQ